MVYFIPGWYDEDEWKERESIWYLDRSRTPIDDTMKEIQLFSRNNLFESKLIVLGFSPNLRHFLHDKSIYRSDYFSVFDSLLSIKRKKVAVISYMDIKWPKGIDFLRTQFAIIGFLNGNKYCKIEFGEYGNMVQVFIYDEDKIARKNVFDDRGFLAMSIIYQNNKPYCEKYLDEVGLCRFTRFLEDGHVEINENVPFYIGPTGDVRFKKNKYENLDELIIEALSVYIRSLRKDDLFIVSLHEKNIRIMTPLLEGRKKIGTIFRDRISKENLNKYRDSLSAFDYIICDTEKNHQYLSTLGLNGKVKSRVITPFDSRVEDGIALEFPVQNVAFPVDALSEEEFKQAIVHLSNYAEENSLVRYQVLTRGDYSTVSKIERWIEESVKPVLVRKFIMCPVKTALEINRQIRENRIILDIQETPDQFYSVTALSMGIPQVVLSGHRYIRNGQNGIILSNLDAIEGSLDYYLSSLSNWNKAKIASYEMGSEFSIEEIKKAWTDVVTYVTK